MTVLSGRRENAGYPCSPCYTVVAILSARKQVPLVLQVASLSRTYGRGRGRPSPAPHEIEGQQRKEERAEPTDATTF